MHFRKLLGERKDLFSKIKAYLYNQFTVIFKEFFLEEVSVNGPLHILDKEFSILQKKSISLPFYSSPLLSY